MMPAAPNPCTTRAMLSASKRRRERAAERGEREHRQPGLRHAPVADDLAERGERQQQHEDRQLVGVDDPDRGGRRWRRNRARWWAARRWRWCCRAPTSQIASSDRRDRPVAARHRQAVGVHGGALAERYPRSAHGAHHIEPRSAAEACHNGGAPRGSVARAALLQSIGTARGLHRSDRTLVYRLSQEQPPRGHEPRQRRTAPQRAAPAGGCARWCTAA